MVNKLVTLVICDGWGEAAPGGGNAVTLAKTPRLDALRAQWPHTTVTASGEPVGLPKGQMGNSEVGHLTIGAGRVLMQPLARQIADSQSGAYIENETLQTAVQTAKERGSQLHIIGLISDGDVHAHTGSALGLLRLAKEYGLTNVYVHAITDGRDTAPMSGKGYLQKLSEGMQKIGVGSFASVGGRYYAMDRDQRWERVQQAYDTMTDPAAATTPDILAYIEQQYSAGTTDEFIAPIAVAASGDQKTSIKDDDVVIFFNFRPDRARQLTASFVDPDFDGFARKLHPHNLHFVTMTEYDESLAVHVAYPREYVRDGLAETVSQAGLRQYHVAETEKYAHVTYFFNGGQELKFDGEDRKLIPSPKVATYDLQPEMSARAVADDAVAAIKSGGYGLVVVNFANADMVGHTGKLDATIKAIEYLDGCVADVIDTAVGQGGVAIMTADHGNAEIEQTADGQPVTAHSTSPVPVLVCGQQNVVLKDSGTLADIAPTVLDIMQLEQPAAMTGQGLITG